ncbi:PAS domain S-box protein [Roseospira marina]|nr:PAS domain S-box protein [Roseospira marina]MBB4314298.1 PAS domain S-box-containing protein [Roseospira marina]MBB5087458.1 PAS domain S-box-containing protein [Roseospira marina]
MDPTFIKPDDLSEIRARRSRQIVMLSGVLVMLLIGGVLGYWSWQSYTAAMNRATEITQAFAQTYSAFTASALDNVDTLLTEVDAFDQARVSGSAPPDLQSFLRMRVGQIPVVRALIVVNADGTPELWTGGWPPPNIANHPDYIAHVEGGATTPWLSPVYRDRTDAARFVFALVRPQRDADGTLVGSVAAIIDQAAFAETYEALLSSDNASVAVVHFNGRIMVRLPDPGQTIGDSIARIARRTPHGALAETYVLRSTVDDVVRVISERQVGHYPLIAGATIAQDAVLASWRRDVAWGLGLFLVSGIAVVGLTNSLMHLDTQQTAARVALQRQNTVLSAQQETSTDGILVASPEGRILSWNRRFAKIWGVSDDALETRETRVLFEAIRQKLPDPSAFAARLRFLYEHLDLDELEGQEIRLTDGRVLERYSRGLHHEDGVGWGRAWFYRDVTRSRADEQALRESEQRFRDVVNAADEYIWEVDAEIRLVFVSERATDTFGVSITELLGRSLLDLVAEEDREWVSALFSAAQLRGAKLDLPEYRIVTASGATVWQRTSGVPVLERTGEVRGYRGASTNISDLKARELELQRANERLEEQARALVDLAGRLDATNKEIRLVQERFDLAVRGSTDGLYDWNLETNRMYVSPRWREMLGLGSTEAEVDPSYGTTRIHAHDYLGAVRALSLYLAGSEDTYRSIHRMLGADGQALWILDRAQVVRAPDGRPVRLVGTHSDVTEMRRYEEALRRAKIEAETANAAKSRFLAMMSHEIRTPMTGVLGMTDLLLASDLSARQRRYTETLKQSADALLALLNDILDFSKIEAGQIHLEAADFDPRPLVTEVAQLFSVTASEKGLTLDAVVETRTPPLVRGDAHRLRQILFNLVSNGIKFTEQGTVRLRLERCVPTAPDAGWELTFAVEDTGIGLSPEQRERLFQPFIQADDTTTRRFGGTGLGLAICKRLVEHMSGDIVVDSALGQGSTFRFWIRAGVAETVGEPAAEGGASPAVRFARAAPGTRLLLAEDTAANRLLIVTMLERLGFTVEEVEDGRAAVEAVAAAPEAFALVVTDMQMPVMDGLAATRAIRALPGDPPPVLGLTADAHPENRAAYIAAGLVDVLTKPVDWDRLTAAVTAHARGVTWVETGTGNHDTTDGNAGPAGGAGRVESTAAARVHDDANDPTGAEPGGPRRAGAADALRTPHPCPLFDSRTLQSLASRMGIARIGPIVESMLSSVSDQMASLNAAARADPPDPEQVGRIGHTLKGLAGQFGAQRLAETGQMLQSRRPVGPDLTDALPGIEATASATQTVVRTWLEEAMDQSA